MRSLPRLDLRRPWLALVCLVLGPFAPWMAYLGKLRRRGLVAPGWWLVLALAFLLAQSVLWLAPLRWEWVVGLYLGWGAISYFGFLQAGALGYFLTGAASPTAREGKPIPDVWECAAVAALVIYPAFFAYGLVRDLDNLREFAIHLPAAVYTEALSFTLIFGTVIAALLALFLRHVRLRPGVRLVLNLYGGALVFLAWITVWERLYAFALGMFGTEGGDPLLFDVYREAQVNGVLRAIFYGDGIFLATAYMAEARRAVVFFRRTVFLGIPILLGYTNLILVLGGGGAFLSGLREHLYREGRYSAFRTVAEIETARLPKALQTPFVLQDLADLSTLQGRNREGFQWRKKLLETCAGRPYLADLSDQVSGEEKQLAAHPGCSPADSIQILPVPTVRPAATLDGNWYALLSAIAYFHPEWNDFDLKKKLLQVSPDVQLSVPLLGGVPSVAEVLDIFGLPFSPCFLDSAGLHRALREGKISWISYQGRWVPIVGWDPCRRGFLGYRYPDSLDKNPWLNPADREALFGGGSPQSGVHAPFAVGRKKRDLHYNRIAFLPEHQVIRHLHDLGGVALVLGDSNFASSRERRAAYLTEYGDVLYQEHDDNEGAQAAYAKAQALYPSDFILSRMLLLERHAAWEEGADYSLETDFRAEFRSRKISSGLPPAERKRLAGKILRGDMGQYLLFNWEESAPRFYAVRDSAWRDTALNIFRTWLRLEPHNPVALDSLAAGFEAERRWDSAETYARRVMDFYPLGNPVAAYRLAWILFQREKYDAIQPWLDRCEYDRNEARYLLMRGALEWNAGHRRAAAEDLRKSLKVDKTLPETHAWLERMASSGDSTARQLERRWRDRTAR